MADRSRRHRQRKGPIMIRYSHYVIAHGKAIAECLAEGRPLSDAKYRRTFANYYRRAES